jgi:DNA invertase Pin-like site-specific DNA recombinase
MYTACYLRCSTSEQDTENQLVPLEKLAEARGWELTAIYRENESAWKAGHQAELAQLLRDAAHRRFEIVLVFALERLTRQGPAATLGDRVSSVDDDALSGNEIGRL